MGWLANMKSNLERRLESLERITKLESERECYVKDVIGEIERDKDRLVQAFLRGGEDEYHEESIRMFSDIRGHHLSREEAEALVDEIDRAVFTPWLSKERAPAGGRRRDG